MVNPLIWQNKGLGRLPGQTVEFRFQVAHEAGEVDGPALAKIPADNVPGRGAETTGKLPGRFQGILIPACGLDVEPGHGFSLFPAVRHPLFKGVKGRTGFPAAVKGDYNDVRIHAPGGKGLDLPVIKELGSGFGENLYLAAPLCEFADPGT